MNWALKRFLLLSLSISYLAEWANRIDFLILARSYVARESWRSLRLDWGWDLWVDEVWLNIMDSNGFELDSNSESL
jgi:hypothetical protein